jgi:hypothetical protein
VHCTTYLAFWGGGRISVITYLQFICKVKGMYVASGLHMIICYYALSEKDKMKRGFQMLLECPLNIDDDEKYNAMSVST